MSKTNIPKDAHQSNHKPKEPGWYECWAKDDRWDGLMRYRAWGNGCWWIPLPDGWISHEGRIYRWRGPVAPVEGPAPDGTNPGVTQDGEERGIMSAIYPERYAHLDCKIKSSPSIHTEYKLSDHLFE